MLLGAIIPWSPEEMPVLVFRYRQTMRKDIDYLVDMINGVNEKLTKFQIFVPESDYLDDFRQKAKNMTCFITYGLLNR